MGIVTFCVCTNEIKLAHGVGIVDLWHRILCAFWVK